MRWIWAVRCCFEDREVGRANSGGSSKPSSKSKVGRTCRKDSDSDYQTVSRIVKWIWSDFVTVSRIVGWMWSDVRLF